MTITLPSMLSFERKLETSDALMFSGTWESIESSKEWSAIPITKRQNRSTQSAHGTSETDQIKPNPVSSNSDDANLSLTHDTLKVSFSVRIIGNLGKPFGCNSPNFSSKIEKNVADFKLSDGINILAYRYAYNLVNGRFLWRNRVGAENIQINVSINNGKPLSFNAYDFSLTNFEQEKTNQNLQILADVIAQGLSGDEQSFTFIKVNAFVKLGYQQHVFPSQEMNMGEKGKTLFQLEGCAAMHNVKIGNAIRTIDTWYPHYPEKKQPIAIEPFGVVTQIGDAFRKNKKDGDLYSLMESWVNDKDITLEQQLYVVGNLIRGGVFSKSSKSES